MNIDRAVETQDPESSHKPLKRVSVSLAAGEGEKAARLTIMARRIRGDHWEVTVVTTDANGKNTRGMTSRVDTFDDASAQVTRLAQDAMKKGWQRRERAGGFKAKPDAFATIPAAPKK